jgi:D-beta-D-heptose 7-phosphate kinase/D-beta-D-heptose 1-phosphate adenosyltransferase
VAVVEAPYHVATFARRVPFDLVTGPDGDCPLLAPVAAAARAIRRVARVAGGSASEIRAAIAGGQTPVTAPTAPPPPDLRSVKRGLSPNRSLATVNGCFDVLHVGHARFLAAARAYADQLVVLVNDDASVRRYKGPERPVFPLPFRLQALGMFASVTAAVGFAEDDPLAALRALRPDVHVKGGRYEPERVRAEEEVLRQWGGRVAFGELVAGHSTSRLIRAAQGKSET